MSPKRIKQRFSDYTKALKRLDEALKEDVSKSSVIVDGAIQRFEFTFELAWKLSKDILNYKGVKVDSPRSSIKEAFQAEMIQDGEEWIAMLEDRNKTSHIYDEKEALKIYEAIKKSYYLLLEAFNSKSSELIEKIET